MTKEDRKKDVQEQRATLKEIGYFEYFVVPMIDYFRQSPLKAVGTFFVWLLFSYLLFSMLQVVYYDTVYCDSSLDEYDGKLLFTYNDFVDTYNSEVEKQKQITFFPMPIINELPTINCSYDWGRYKSQPIKEKLYDISREYYVVVTKR